MARYLYVRLSVRLSVTFVYSIQTAADIVKLLCRPGSSVILVFFTQAPLPKFNGNPISGDTKQKGWENLRFSTEIAVYLGNGTR